MITGSPEYYWLVFTLGGVTKTMTTTNLAGDCFLYLGDAHTSRFLHGECDVGRGFVQPQAHGLQLILKNLAVPVHLQQAAIVSE